MYVINARNVNDAWPQAKALMAEKGVLRDSRNGPVLEVPAPVATYYSHPTERLLFDPIRDVNPFFHFFEGLWMLAGRADVAWISQFNSRISQYSDDGHSFHGAYGYRWRRHFLFDQLGEIVEMLKKNPDDRRAVLQMWDCEADLGMDGKDFPCNTQVYFKIRKNQLHMTVCCRSNDALWGCYGANVVHMSMMQEYMASMIGVAVGPYCQVSDSWHVYTEFWDKYKEIVAYHNPYDELGTYEMVGNPPVFDMDLLAWMEKPSDSYPNLFFQEVATPLLNTWKAYKVKDFPLAFGHLELCHAPDLYAICHAWLARRQK
jgi:hypothetical protein